MPAGRFFELKAKKDRPTGKVSKATKRYVDRRVRDAGEVKFLYEAHGAVGANINSVGALSLYAMAEGTGAEENRIGDTIHPTSLQIRMSAYRGNADGTLRLIVFRWKERDLGSDVELTNVLEQLSYGTDNYVNAPTKIQKVDSNRFNILLDKRYVLDDAKQNHVSVVHNIKVAAKKIYYSSGLLNSERTNDIYWTVLSDTLPLNEPTVNIQTIARFTDK